MDDLSLERGEDVRFEVVKLCTGPRVHKPRRLDAPLPWGDGFDGPQ